MILTRKLLLSLALAGYCGRLIAQDAPRPPASVERTGFLGAMIRESSGVAASRAQPGVLWTHNDSGDEPRVFAIDLSGADLGAFRVGSGRGRDWEDIAVGRCPSNDGWCLYIADTGDNLETHPHATLIVIREPDVSRAAPATGTEVPVVALLRVRYSDRPHDIEAIVARPDRIDLFTKGRTGPVVRFGVPIRAFQRDTFTASPDDTLAMRPSLASGRLVSGGAISPSGRRAVLRTYTELFFFSTGTDGRMVPERDPWWIGGLREPQGEGVAFLDEDTLVLTSESVGRERGTIYRVRCPPAAPN